jgi:hypothetical protein
MVKGVQPKTERIRGGDHVPYGMARNDVRHAIIANATPGEAFTTSHVWSWFTDRQQADWRYYYGGTKKAKERLGQTLNSIYKKVKFRDFPLTKVRGRNSTYIFNDPRGSGARHVAAAPSNEPKRKPKPKSRPATPHPLTKDYELWGTTVDGVDLYITKDGTMGYIQFVPIGHIGNGGT